VSPTASPSPQCMHKLSQRNALSLNPAPYPSNPALLPHPLGGNPNPQPFWCPCLRFLLCIARTTERCSAGRPTKLAIKVNPAYTQ